MSQQFVVDYGAAKPSSISQMAADLKPLLPAGNTISLRIISEALQVPYVIVFAFDGPDAASNAAALVKVPAASAAAALHAAAFAGLGAPPQTDTSAPSPSAPLFSVAAIAVIVALAVLAAIVMGVSIIALRRRAKPDGADALGAPLVGDGRSASLRSAAELRTVRDFENSEANSLYREDP